MTEQDKGDPKGRSRYDITPEEFVTAWNSSKNAGEVADKLGMPKPLVLARASKYRKAGVKLKEMKRGSGRRLDVEGLNRLIAELEAKQRGAGSAAKRGGEAE